MRVRGESSAPVSTETSPLIPPDGVVVAKWPPRPGPHRDPRVVVAVAIGGVIGALLRAELEQLFPAGAGFPWTTLLVNFVGTAILAWVVVRVGERLPPSTYVRPILGTGFCGGLTTFSTMQVEAVRLIHQGDPISAVSYLILSLVGGVLVAALVIRSARRARWTA